jgi:hypothetical protein
MPHYHRRNSVSLPGSRWSRVVPLCYSHQIANLSGLRLIASYQGWDLVTYDVLFFGFVKELINWARLSAERHSIL